MAPIRPTTRKRTSIRSRAERSAKDPRGIYAPPLTPIDATETAPAQDDGFTELGEAGFKVSKKDKRTIKHNQLLAKVQEGGIRKQSARSRRRAKKNQLGGSGLTGLQDALPDVEDEEEWEGVEDEEGGMDIDGLRKAGKRQKKGGEKIVLKSVKTRPGATKRKMKMEKGERERFRRNMAEMIGNAEKSGDEDKAQQVASVHGDRWKALRAFIGGTMEKSKAFLAGNTT